jgi:hypothetical protein
MLAVRMRVAARRLHRTDDPDEVVRILRELFT